MFESAPTVILTLIYSYRDAFCEGELLNCWEDSVSRKTKKSCCVSPYEVNMNYETNYVQAVAFTFLLLASDVSELFDQYSEYGILQDVPYYNLWSTCNRADDLQMVRQVFITEIIPSMLKKLRSYELDNLGVEVMKYIKNMCDENDLITPEVRRLLIEGGVRFSLEVSYRSK